jgi:hypothetical protein
MTDLLRELFIFLTHYGLPITPCFRISNKLKATTSLRKLCFITSWDSPAPLLEQLLWDIFKFFGSLGCPGEFLKSFFLWKINSYKWFNLLFGFPGVCFHILILLKYMDGFSKMRSFWTVGDLPLVAYFHFLVRFLK